MRTTALMILAIAIFTLPACRAGGPHEPDAASAAAASVLAADESPVDAATATLTVRGLSCPQCAHNVDQQLLKTPGVRDVEVDLGAGEIRLRLADSPKPTRAQLARAIDQAGFTLVSIQTP